MGVRKDSRVMRNLFVISIWASIDGNTGTQKDEFYDELATPVCKGRVYDIAAVADNFNAQM